MKCESGIGVARMPCAPVDRGVRGLLGVRPGVPGVFCFFGVDGVCIFGVDGVGFFRFRGVSGGFGDLQKPVNQEQNRFAVGTYGPTRTELPPERGVAEPAHGLMFDRAGDAPASLIATELATFCPPPFDAFRGDATGSVVWGLIGAGGLVARRWYPPADEATGVRTIDTSYRGSTAGDGCIYNHIIAAKQLNASNKTQIFIWLANWFVG